jgi:hypothetical protein
MRLLGLCAIDIDSDSGRESDERERESIVSIKTATRGVEIINILRCSYHKAVCVADRDGNVRIKETKSHLPKPFYQL